MKLREGTWRARWAPIIARVLEAMAGYDERSIRAALWRSWDEAGSGERRFYSYRIWCAEIRRQRGRPRRPRRKARQLALPGIEEEIG